MYIYEPFLGGWHQFQQISTLFFGVRNLYKNILCRNIDNLRYYGWFNIQMMSIGTAYTLMTLLDLIGFWFGRNKNDQWKTHKTAKGGRGGGVVTLNT